MASISSPRTRSLLRQLVPALALAAVSVGGAVSLAALVFSGPASTHLGRGVVTFVIGSAVASVLVSARSSFDVVVATAKNNLTVVIATITSGIAVAAPEVAGPTVAVFVVIAALVSGLALFAVGRLRYGNMVRYVPYPVMSGYVAATGWLMVHGGLGVMLDRSIGLADVGELFGWDVAQRWLPGLALVLLMVTAGTAIWQSLVIVGAIGLFFVVAVIAGTLESAEAGGWLLGPLPSGSGLILIPPSELSQVAWTEILARIPALGAVVIIAVTGLLLNVTGVEFVTGERLDLDRELELAGRASVASGFFGGTVAFVGVGQTLLARQMALTSALASGVFAATGVVTILIGPSIIGMMPRFVVGGLLMAPGAGLLWNWMTGTTSWGGRTDRVVSGSILAAVAFFGVLAGVAFGLVMAAVIFVWRYAAVDPVVVESSARSLRSSRDRPAAHRSILDEHGGQVEVLGLAGYLFFGSASSVGDRVRHLVVEGSSSRQLIIDFRRVSGIDSSARAELGNVEALCAAHDITLRYCEAQPERVGALTGPESAVTHHPDLDRALDAAENELLSQYPVDADPAEPGSLSEGLADWFESVDVEVGQALIERGSQGGALYVVKRGTFTISTTVEGTTRRLRLVGPGAFLGEVNFFAGKSATADVCAEEPAVVARLTPASYQRLRTERPDLANRLHEELLGATGQRLAMANHLIRDLLR